MLIAAQEQKIKRFVYASSSSVYGDSPILPKSEQQLGQLLSPYAVSKMTNELYGKVFTRCYDLPTLGLRYFNVFGERQSPDGPYAAVIPRWVKNLLEKKSAIIYGDGETTRDFCFVANAVQANLLAAMTDNHIAFGQVFNIAVGQQTSLNALYAQIAKLLDAPEIKPIYENFRPGDIRDSLADIGLAQKLLGYTPTHTVADGLKVAMEWYKQQ
jgi:UDP-N-acetylglucosamine/UDP-N-acetylgalactosamine 4-epimerase